MEQRYTNQYLLVKGIEKDSHVFFLQKWMELLHPLTLDTYSIRSTNSHYILKELVEVISLFNAGIIKQGNVKPLAEECLLLIKEDAILEKHAKQIKNILLSYLAMTKNADDLPIILYHLSWAVKRLENSYLNWCIASLKQSLTTRDLNLIESITSILVTELVQNGWTPTGLRELGNNLISNSKKQTVEQALKDFYLTIDQQKLHFKCLVKIPNAESIKLDELFKMAGHNVIAGALASRHLKIPALIHKLSPSNTYALIDIRAHDNHGAARQAFEKVLRLINIMSFYELDNLSMDKSITIIVVNTDDQRIFTNDVQLPWFHRKHTELSTTLFKSTFQILDQQSPSNNINEKFNSLFLYSRLAEDNLSPEASFLNYWIALESFVKIDDHRSTLEQITNVVPAVLGNRYIYYLIRNFFEDCKRCKVELEQLSPIFNTETSLSAIVKEILTAIRDPERSSTLEALCSKHTLLLHRYRTLHAAFSSSTNIAKLKEKHYKNVKWQLARLYRLRNKIAHSGSSPDNIELLLGNLKTYVRQTVQETLIRLDKTPHSSINETFALICDSYNCTNRLLNDKNHKCTPELLLEGPFN